jgi:hypothetical protein
MPAQEHHQIRAAVEQLHLAIDLYFDGSYLSAITLAGAAEGVLCCPLKKDNRAFEQTKSFIGKLTELFTGENRDDKSIGDDLNLVRNWLKHYDPKRETLSFDARDQAYEMIERAIEDYWKLGQNEGRRGHWWTEPMQRFRYAPRNGQ